MCSVVLQVPNASDSTSEPGCGVTATVEGSRVAVGRLDWLQQQERIQSSSSASTSTSSSSSSEDRHHAGQSVVYVGVEGQGVIGSLGFSDTLRVDAHHVVQQLQGMGIHVMLISGQCSTPLCVVIQVLHTHLCGHSSPPHPSMRSYQFCTPLYAVIPRWSCLSIDATTLSAAHNVWCQICQLRTMFGAAVSVQRCCIACRFNLTLLSVSFSRIMHCVILELCDWSAGHTQHMYTAAQYK